MKYTYETEYEFLCKHKSFPREKHATISVLAFKPNKLSEQDDYLNHVNEEHSIMWLKEK